MAEKSDITILVKAESIERLNHLYRFLRQSGYKYTNLSKKIKNGQQKHPGRPRLPDHVINKIKQKLAEKQQNPELTYKQIRKNITYKKKHPAVSTIRRIEKTMQRH